MFGCDLHTCVICMHMCVFLQPFQCLVRLHWVYHLAMTEPQDMFVDQSNEVNANTNNNQKVEPKGATTTQANQCLQWQPQQTNQAHHNTQ